MWLNSRDLSTDDDGASTRDGVWGFAASNQSAASHGTISGSGSRALWNRMEPAEEEREEEALPSYLSYLQPAFRPAPATPTTLAPSAPQTPAFYTAKRAAPGLPTPPTPMPQPVQVTQEVGNVARKSSELAQALEHLVLGSVQRHLGDATPDKTPQARCRCACDSMRAQMNEMAVQMQSLQHQVLELTKNSIPTAIEVGRVSIKASSPSNGSWSANAAPFVPKQQQQQQQYKQQTQPPPPPPPPASAVDQATATVLSDRISTLEGRQSAFQSQLAQIAKVLGIPTGKPGKHSPVKHLVQTLRDEVDAKVQQATAEARTDLTAEINAALGDIAAGKPAGGDSQDALSSNAVLAALAGEHEASLARLSGSFEELLAEEARQRAALEARVRSQLAQQEEWLQQLEGAFGSPHDPEHEQEPRSKDPSAQSRVDAKLAQLERKCDESRELCRRLSRLLPEAANSRLRTRHGYEEEEEEDGQSWPGHLVGRG